MADPSKNTPKSAPSTTDVAKAAGVSRMTVSRVLRGERYVKPEMEKRVLEAIEKVGYRANPMVQAFMSAVRRKHFHVSSNIAWVEQKREDRGKMDRLIQGARTRAEELGFGFERILLEDAPMSAERMDGILRSRGVSGVILAPLRLPGVEFDFPWGGYAVSTLGRSLASPMLSHVMMHQQHATETALYKIAERGYERIAFFSLKDSEKRTDNAQLMAYLLFNHERPKKFQLPPVLLDSIRPEALAAWCERHRPDAVLSSSPGTLDLLETMGYRVPADMGFAALTWRTEYAAVSGIRVPSEDIGAVAVDIVVAQIHRNEYGIPARPKAMMLEGEWVEGQTLRRPVRDATDEGVLNPSRRRGSERS